MVPNWPKLDSLSRNLYCIVDVCVCVVCARGRGREGVFSLLILTAISIGHIFILIE